jgi:uncharacterized membrane protein YidH (DUF202 family)
VTSPEPADDRRRLVHLVAALERTALSWERTAIASGAVGTLLVKLPGNGQLVRASGMVLLAGALAVVTVMVPIGYRRTRSRVAQSLSEEAPLFSDPWRRRVMLGTAVVATSVTAAVAGEMLWLAFAGSA